jgi:hypothetical protein
MIESVRGAEVQRGGQGGRWYIWKRDRFWSVTTIISGGLPKPVLVNWAKKFTAEYAVTHLEQLNALVRGPTGDPDGAIDWLKGAAYRDRDKKANVGTLFHDVAEAYVIRRPYPEPSVEQMPYLITFETFLAEFTPTFVAVEMPVFNRQYLYAGTLDAIMDIPVELLPECEVWGPAPEDRPWRILVDYKTGASGPWPEVGLQNTAYRRAEYTGLPNGREGEMPQVDGCAVLKIRPEGYEFYPVRSDQLMFDTFLYCREVYRFAQEISKDVIGSQIVSEAALRRALEQSLEATRGQEKAGESLVTLLPTAEEPARVASENGEGAGGQENVSSSPPQADGQTEEPAPAPSPKPRKPRAKKATA